MLVALAWALVGCGGGIAGAAAGDGGVAIDGGDQADGGALDGGAGQDAGAASDAGAPADGGAAPLAGNLIAGPGPAPGAIGGVRWRSGALSGFTDDAGSFQYLPDAGVSFSVAGVQLGAVAGAARVTPFDLIGQGCTVGEPLTRLLVLLQSLDGDQDPANGLALPHFDEVAAGSISQLTRAELARLVAQLAAVQPAADADAIDRFIAQVDGEQWQQVGLDSFAGVDAARRSQGAATDGQHLYFSSQLTLQRTDLGYRLLAENDTAIPAQLALQGSNHIGDIDYAGGIIYAGIEDGHAYAHPRIGLFDAATLAFQSSVDVSPALQTQGVPWVAVDGARGYLYAAEWTGTTEVHAFDLRGQLAFVKSIPLHQRLDRIQGAKVSGGMLYASVDQDAKFVAKINLDTGTVLRVLELNLTGVEEEGLVHLPGLAGGELHTLNVNAGRSGMELRHHARTRPPLRQSICP